MTTMLQNFLTIVRTGPGFPALVAGLLFFTMPVSADNEVELYAAGSLKSALGEVVENYQAEQGATVVATFNPSGLLREKIEQGAAAQVFASANMKHPVTLEKQGMGGPVTLFARNKLCALAREDLMVDEDSLLEVLLDPAVRVGTSTPGADPSGDYAWELFARAGDMKAGSKQLLESKALPLTGGADSEKAPEGHNQYGWVMQQDKADIFLTYCTNAVLARKQVPGLQIVSIPVALSVGANYGLTVLDQENPAAWRLAFYILSPRGQEVLERYGFEAPGVDD